ncbi:hypothetical protein L596_025271 [Steinernema carpocapsae]|uniref:Uncharacterized protein n=1 Tax=Steinernema carpocapsae TaxID=34508 RepID=A0A4U5M7B4_STECR|nr:hypothetical protein L596_025271 [Steinernema carpocapsae]
MSRNSLYVPFDECRQLKQLLNQYDPLKETTLHPNPIVYNFDEIELDKTVYQYLPRNVSHPVFSSVMTIAFSTAECSVKPVGAFFLYLGLQDERSGKLIEVFGPFLLAADKVVREIEIDDDYENNKILCGQCNCLLIRKYSGVSWKPRSIQLSYKRDQVRQTPMRFTFPEENSVGWIAANGFYVLNCRNEFIELCGSDKMEVENLINRFL